MSLINFDNANNSSATASTTLTYSLTIGTQDDMVLVVGVVVDATATVSSVTYNGVALTKFKTISFVGVTVEGWYLIAPATGANNVVVTASISTNIVSGASSYFGCDQETQFTNTSSATGLSTAVSTTTTTNLDGRVVDVVTINSAVNTLTVGAGQTQRYNGTGSAERIASSDEDATGSSVISSWTVNVSSRWGIVAGELIPVLPPRGSLMMVGVGI